MEKTSISTLFVNYLIIALLGVYGFFIMVFTFKFTPEMTRGTVTYILLPVFLDWIISLLSVFSLKLLIPLKLIDTKRRFSIENIFFMAVSISFFLFLIYVFNITILPEFTSLSRFSIAIIPILFVKNIWFALQYKKKLLKEGFYLTISFFIIALFVLSAIQIIGETISGITMQMRSLFDIFVYMLSGIYFLFVAFLCYRLVRRYQYENLELD